ncbi:MAG: L-2-hydroxyglutarate oxidase [Actinomycetia bacterium]|nr:L-2-hydroxyglutarate oxidase [Actinomycetes bacterium]
MTTDVDIVIVGAGIVGLATAHALASARPDLSLLILEKEPTLAAHQTGRNSGVIHSGIYYRPDSLKTSLVRRGRELLTDFCIEHDIAHDYCGKVIVATSTDELPRLRDLEIRADQNGIEATMVGPAGLRDLEAHATGLEALHVPTAGIVDYVAMVDALAAGLTERGHEVRTSARVGGLREEADVVRVEVADSTITASWLVNCGGLQSDRLAAHTGETPARIMPFRGEYHELKADRRHLVRNLIYPVPDPEFPFLGVHFTRMIDGNVHAGPNAVPAFAREGYAWRNVVPRDAWEIISAASSWKLAAQYWKTGMGEVKRSVSLKAMTSALQRLVPDVTADDLEPSPAGVRAQAITADGTLLDDFAFADTDRCVHVVNAPSPAATASLAIGEQIADRLLRGSGRAGIG